MFTFSIHSFLSSILPFNPIFLSSSAFLLRPFRFSCCVSTVVFDFPFIFSKDLVMCLVTQSYLTVCYRMDCSLPGSSVHGDSPARIPEWVSVSSSRGSSQPRDQTCISFVSCVGRWVLYHQRPLEALVPQLWETGCYTLDILPCA